MATVTIQGNEYPVYADRDAAEEYAVAAFHATDWLLLSDEDKDRTLVTATRMLDRQSWQGTRTDANQDLAWPRDNVGCPDVVDGVIPQNVITASIEIAIAFASGSDMQSGNNVQSQLQSIRAGDVSLTYFWGSQAEVSRFPTIVQELLACMLGAGAAVSGALGAFSSGTGGSSVTNQNFGFNDPL